MMFGKEKNKDYELIHCNKSKLLVEIRTMLYEYKTFVKYYDACISGMVFIVLFYFG